MSDNPTQPTKHTAGPYRASKMPSEGDPRWTVKTHDRIFGILVTSGDNDEANAKFAAQSMNQAPTMAEALESFASMEGDPHWDKFVEGNGGLMGVIHRIIAESKAALAPLSAEPKGDNHE